MVQLLLGVMSIIVRCYVNILAKSILRIYEYYLSDKWYWFCILVYIYCMVLDLAIIIQQVCVLQQMVHRSM